MFSSVATNGVQRLKADPAREFSKASLLSSTDPAAAQAGVAKLIPPIPDGATTPAFLLSEAGFRPYKQNACYVLMKGIKDII